MMYWNWKKRGVRPSEFYKMSKGEQLILRAFFEYEVDEELQKQKIMAEKGVFCPFML